MNLNFFSLKFECDIPMLVISNSKIFLCYFFGHNWKQVDICLDEYQQRIQFHLISSLYSIFFLYGFILSIKRTIILSHREATLLKGFGWGALSTRGEGELWFFRGKRAVYWSDQWTIHCLKNCVILKNTKCNQKSFTWIIFDKLMKF